MTSLRPRFQKHVVSPLGVFCSCLLCFFSFSGWSFSRFCLVRLLRLLCLLLLLLGGLGLLVLCRFVLLCSLLRRQSRLATLWAIALPFVLLSAAFSFGSSVVWGCPFFPCRSSASFGRLGLVALSVSVACSLSSLSFLFGGFLSCVFPSLSVLVLLFVALLFPSVVWLVWLCRVAVVPGCCVLRPVLFLGLSAGVALPRAVVLLPLPSLSRGWLALWCACVLAGVLSLVSSGLSLCLWRVELFCWGFAPLFFR